MTTYTSQPDDTTGYDNFIQDNQPDRNNDTAGAGWMTGWPSASTTSPRL